MKDAILGRLGKVKGPDGKGEYQALCPFHPDQNPSLSVNFEKGVYYCQGCQSSGPVTRLAQRLGVDCVTSANPKKEDHQIAATYDYTDKDGQILFQTVRYSPKDFKQRRPDGAGGWIYDLKGITRVLYRLPEVIKAVKKGETVYLCEGEKDCDNLRKLGLVATTNPMGAGKWRPAYTESLTEANVVILPDLDEPGRKHAQQVAQSLYGKAASVKIAELPGEGVKDVSDWLQAGGTREDLDRLVSEVKQPSTKPQSRFVLTKLADLLAEPPEDISFVWDNTLPKGGLSLLVAKPKVGKSTLARNLALKIARGDAEFLVRAITSPGPVVYLALEEKRSEVRKHFERMGATENLPVFIHIGSAPEEALEELRKAIIDNKAVFAIVDPLQRLVRIPDLNDYSSVSLALEPLMQIARDTGCHIMLVHHATKGIAREGGDSILGSTALFGGVDCALIMRRTESCRTIESIQRYGEDLPRTVLAFDAATGLTTSGGSLEDVQQAECGKEILELMANHEMTEPELQDAIHDRKRGVVSKSLRLLHQQGEVQRNGAGKKGDPFRYQAVKNSRDSRDTDIEIPTIPSILPEREADQIPSQHCRGTDFAESHQNGDFGIPSILPLAGAKGERL